MSQKVISKNQKPFSESALEALRYYLPTILVALAVLLAWELLVIAFNIQQFLLPKPSAIWAELWSEIQIGAGSLLFEASRDTFYEAVGGLALDCGAGILVAMVTARWTIISEAAMPFAIAANSVPIIAFAPMYE